MKNHPISYQTAKFTASLIHLAAVAVMFLGIGLMYLNDNLGVGITKIQNVPYENTEEFSEIFNRDLDDIFHYIDYNEIFATDGSIDVTKRMLQMTFGPNETLDYSLGDLISYLQSLGYQLSEDFSCTGEADPQLSAKSPVGYVDWSALEPDVMHTRISTTLRRGSLEELSLDIMATLNRYYVTYNRLMVNPSNLHFKIVYANGNEEKPRELVYTNDPALTEDKAVSYGKYALLKGNSVFYDTNLRSIALNTISALSSANPYDSNTYYLLAAVDTKFPAKDGYFKAQHAYVQMQQNYITGFVLMALSALAAVVTLLFLLAASGHRNRHDKTITLHGFDKTSTETGIVLFSCLTLVSLYVCRYTLVRVAHLAMAEDSWELGERVLYTAIFYLGCLLLFFSMLRRYKAGTIWSNSLVCKCGRKCSIFFEGQDFTGRLILGFGFYLVLNTTLISLVWFLSRKIYMGPVFVRVSIGVSIAIWAALNLWSFYLLFRRQSEHAKIHNAVERLAAGETSYQVNLDDFEGKERELAEGINHISEGLETALQEKVKSERLKADLITNVSHDIKTPLTSIINYVDLIKRENIQDEKIKRYLEVLEQKSQRLKTLTEDLVEASKASSGNLKLETCDIDFIELVYQTNGEFEEKFLSRRLELLTDSPDETYIIEADGRRLWRVLENLYNNAFKYAMDGSRIYVDIFREPGTVEELTGTQGIQMNQDGAGHPSRVIFTIKNVSSNPLNIRPDELTERFVRGDVARTTEGSGLGLSIAKSLTELQRGQFEIFIDGDLFKVQLAFDIKEIRRGGNPHA